MSLIESDSGQQANELADILASRRFPDGTVMLQYLHANGHLKKVPTNLVIMTPSSQSSTPLDELNQMIAEQKGVTVAELAVTEDGAVKEPVISEEIIVPDVVVPETKKLVTVEDTDEISDPVLVAKQYRSKADKLSKDAANFRRMADAIDPPKAKTKKVAEAAE
jgi:hypothetical protein